MSRTQAEEIIRQLRSGKRWEGIFRVHRKDGTEFSAFVADSPILNDDGELIGIVGISHDVSKELEDRQFLNTILKESPIPTAVGGTDGSIISFNHALESLIGYKQSEISDVNDWAQKLYPDNDYRAFVMQNIHKALEGKKQDCTVFEITCKKRFTENS